MKKNKSKPKKKKLNPTIEQIVEACHAAGASVSFELVPNGSPAAPVEPPWVRHNVPLNELPGGPSNRSLIAHAADDKEVAKEFKDSPTSLWVITPTRIIFRDDFFKPKPPPDLQPQQAA